jgi:hypothetical protein
MLQYLDAEVESRTGVSKQTQGIDANALQNQSATAVAQVFGGKLPPSARGVGLDRTLTGGPARAAENPEILPDELAGRTRSQIRDLVTDKGLVPKGDPLHPDYPRKWNDPVTNERRLRLDRGHPDSITGQPYGIRNAAVDHVHAYDINGNSIKVNGDNHIPTTGE